MMSFHREALCDTLLQIGLQSGLLSHSPCEGSVEWAGTQTVTGVGGNPRLALQQQGSHSMTDAAVPVDLSQYKDG